MTKLGLRHGLDQVFENDPLAIIKSESKSTTQEFKQEERKTKPVNNPTPKSISSQQAFNPKDQLDEKMA